MPSARRAGQMPSFLSFDYRAGRTEVAVSRESDVPDLLWLKLQSEWGTEGRSPGMGINVPVSVFSSGWTGWPLIVGAMVWVCGGKVLLGTSFSVASPAPSCWTRRSAAEDLSAGTRLMRG